MLGQRPLVRCLEECGRTLLILLIDVRIKDNGLDSIEVVDNGSGIAEADWESIGGLIITAIYTFAHWTVALRHHTSKLPSLEDLHKVTTFGFRGEALSALAALCDSITVVTATKVTAPMGAVIKLGTGGRTVDTSGRVARPVCLLGRSVAKD